MNPEPIDNTQLEPPETPAPVFAARAIKHAIFGTPAPPETVKPVKTEPKTGVAATSRPLFDKSAPRDNAPDQGGPRRAGGILSTPGTVKDRKTVSFGAHVVDNEGKKPGKSGLPNNFPGKFPSPWTPKTDPLFDESEDRPSSSSKLHAKLYEARNSSIRPEQKAEEPPRPKPRTKDDGDITVDVMEPRSESGRYWKEEYMAFAYQSEREARKIIKKHQIAKDYARKKDHECLELREQLETERKRHSQREKELEAKNKDYKERLRQAMAENLKSSTEIAMLKQRLAVLEGKPAPDPTADHSMPKTDLEMEFDQMMLDPQQASFYSLDATPVNERTRFDVSKKKPEPSPPEQRTKATATLLPPSVDPRSQSGISPRRPRRSTTGNKSDKPSTSRSHAKTASASAVEDPWMANSDSVLEVKASNSVSPVKRRTTNRANTSLDTQDEAAPRRAKSDRHLKSLVNASSSDPPATTTDNLTSEEMRKKLAKERILQKKREREMGKENARANIATMR